MVDDPESEPTDTPDESHEDEESRTAESEADASPDAEASTEKEPDEAERAESDGTAEDERPSGDEGADEDEGTDEEAVEARRVLNDAEDRYGEGGWSDADDEDTDWVSDPTDDPTLDIGDESDGPEPEVDAGASEGPPSPGEEVESVIAEPPEAGFEDEGEGWGTGPETDEEMPLAEHIEEMMRRLSVVFVVGGAVSLAVLGLGELVSWIPTAVDIIDFLWNHNIPGAPELKGRRPRIYGPLELLLTKLKVAGLAGILVGLPVFVYETYLFMRPGLYPNERRYYLAAVPTSLVLGVIGMAFAHFVVLPSLFSYFTVYTQGTAMVAYGLSETFNLILLLMGYMAIIFQIPLFIMLAIMMDLVTRIWLEDKRLLFWGSFLGIAFLVSPDPTGMAPIIIAATMVVLYEGTLALLRWTGN